MDKETEENLEYMKTKGIPMSPIDCRCEICGKEHEVEVVVSNYNEDQVFKGMVIENITQRTNDFMELNENIVAIESYLNSKKDILKGLRESRQPSKFSNIQSFDKAKEMEGGGK